MNKQSDILLIMHSYIVRESNTTSNFGRCWLWKVHLWRRSAKVDNHSFPFGLPPASHALALAFARSESHFSFSRCASSAFWVRPSNTFTHPPPRVRMSTERPVLVSMYVAAPSTSATMHCCLSEKSEVTAKLRLGSTRISRYAAMSFPLD